MASGGIRVRYAPSPTGEPHVGNIRTALYDWVFARSNGGKFVVRIEDTDQSRKVEGAEKSLEDSLTWLGLDWDEGMGKSGGFGPYSQSGRLELYKDVVEALIRNEFAYRCFCTENRLANLRDEQRKSKSAVVGYDGMCRGKYVEDATNEPARGDFVVRFAMPKVGTSEIEDLVKGHVSFENSLSDDFIVLKSDGYPTYHLASVVDDNHMRISHVFRGEEWLSSVPRHIQLYKAMGWNPPIFAHLPTILAPDKSKLSKRHGATSVLQFKKMGYVPEAMFNFLCLLGWSKDGETEILNRKEILEHFDIAQINPSGAVFDIEKLNWMNGYYIRQMTLAKLADTLSEYWVAYPPDQFDRTPTSAEVMIVAKMVQERLKTLEEASRLVAFLFKEDLRYDSDALIQKGMDAKIASDTLTAAKSLISGSNVFDAEKLEISLRELAVKLDVKVGSLLSLIRVATSGQKVSPPLFISLEALGKERVLKLLEEAVVKLTSASHVDVD